MIIVILAVILAILFCLLFAPVKIEVRYKERKMQLGVYLCGIRVYNLNDKKKTAVKEYNDPKEFEKDTTSLKNSIKKFVQLYKTAVKLLKKYVSIKIFELNLRVGTSDAATTAISTGALWAAVYGVLGLIGRIVYIDEHKVNIVPDYAQTIFSVDGKCIIKSRVVYIIIIVATILIKINPQKGKEE